MRAKLLFLLCAGTAFARKRPLVRTRDRSFLGNASIENVDQFLGIKYAAPPIDDLRFANPQPTQSASSVVYAHTYGHGCPQDPQFAMYNGLSEDCLSLNILRPREFYKHELLPVLFWIHGGGNTNGQSLFYNGTALVEHSITLKLPVVYVSINYRLGDFGFLNSPEIQDAGASNLGLKDQRQALMWVHDNIRSFGGDPDKVTIFGESAGAANCWAQAHYASTHNETGRNFRAMITQSGAPGSPLFPQTVTPQLGITRYRELERSTNCSSGGVSCLRKVPYLELSRLLQRSDIIPFTIDHDWFRRPIHCLIDTDQFPALPVIHGTNLNEGSFFMPDLLEFPARRELVETISGILGNDTRKALQIFALYWSSSDLDLGMAPESDKAAPHGYWVAQAIYTDIYMNLGRREWLLHASRKMSTWGYEFRQQPPLNAVNLSYEYPGTNLDAARRAGVFHGAELPYVFGEITGLANRKQGDDDVAIKMMAAWISFAWYLNPNNEADTIFWPQYGPSIDAKLKIFEDQSGSTIRMAQDTTRVMIQEIWRRAIAEHETKCL